jgi:hypothetical protein
MIYLNPVRIMATIILKLVTYKVSDVVANDVMAVIWKGLQWAGHIMRILIKRNAHMYKIYVCVLHSPKSERILYESNF